MSFRYTTACLNSIKNAQQVGVNQQKILIDSSAPHSDKLLTAAANN